MMIQPCRCGTFSDNPAYLIFFLLKVPRDTHLPVAELLLHSLRTRTLRSRSRRLTRKRLWSISDRHGEALNSPSEAAGDLCTESGQTLQGSFSAVAKPNLQVSTRWKALAEIYTMHSFAPFWNPFSNLNVFLKIA